jgi:hypothetical protein
MERPPAIAPETADWTFVIGEGCTECGFSAQDVESTGDRLRATIPRWQEALSRPDASERPRPTVWSPLEYACHVRDTCRVFRDRLELTLGQDDPTFANWDQDATAVEEEYFRQVPATVAEQLVAEVQATASAFDAVRPDEWERPSRRSNGSPFTVRTLAVYFLHDVEHHVHDVAR